LLIGLPMIRIMHVVDHLGKGGLENGLVNLISHLHPQRFEHVVYAIRRLGPNAERLSKDRVRVICQGKQDSDSRFQVGTLARAIREIRPEVVHSRNWGTIEAVLAGRLVRAAAVVHSEHGIETGLDAKEPWRRICFRRLSYELADRVLSVSYGLRDFHARRTGFSADRITVIHNGVDNRLFFPDPAGRARMRRELGIGEDEFLIGCVGNLLPVKDHVTVLRAVDILSRQFRNWRLIIAGEGPERPKLEAFLDGHLEWRSRVSLAGNCERMPELLNAMDAYVLSSLSEGISNSLLEAMASGLAIVATNVGGNPEVVVDSGSGLLFPVGDCGKLAEHLNALQLHPVLRARLAQQALLRVRAEFSLDTMVEKYAQLYESACGADPPDLHRTPGPATAGEEPTGARLQIRGSAPL
jgi:sugar transferase (PEP-CTERM/EpsH1 system associated)